jgi:hypothetical protein
VKTVTNTPVCSLLEGVSISVLIIEPLLISGNYQQRSINNGHKTASDAILEPLLMTISVIMKA